jgi:D-alanine-D-alanine ligase-like ATP-grasp enzyme/GNAT superfamily N-acetyltransferase
VKVLVLHDPVAPDARPDELDTLVQVEAIAAALARRGHAVARLAFGPDLAANERALVAARADVVFNLVESHLGRGRLIANATALLEALGQPFTGAPHDALVLSTSKLLTKRVLAAADLPTPDWHVTGGHAASVPGRFIVKSVHEHGSLGLEVDSVVDVRTTAELDAAIAARRGSLGGEAFAEGYVHGREFNVAVIAQPDGPRCLPIPEILFEGLASDDTPRVVGYRAKWAEGSAEYVGTPRHFASGGVDGLLHAELERLALATWRAFGFAGYLRVDFRVDASGAPYVIDVNANPCLSPDAGFAAALERADVPYDAAIEAIALDAVRRAGRTVAASETAPARSARAVPAHTLRTEVRPGDAARVRAMCASTGFFSDEELDIAVELVEEHLAKGEAASGYSFVFLDVAGETLAYASYGRIPGTESAFDLYWIATDDAHRGRGFGQVLVAEVEARIAAGGGGQIHVETSSRAQYDPTRAFYERCGYLEAARFPDFYKPGDGKVVFVKTV